MKHLTLLLCAGVAGLVLAGCANHQEKMTTIPAASGETSPAGVGGTTSVPSAQEARTSGR